MEWCLVQQHIQHKHLRYLTPKSKLWLIINVTSGSHSLLTVNDTLDDIFDESGDEEESQDIVNQVLDEIGIEISGKVRNWKSERNYDWPYTSRIPELYTCKHFKSMGNNS